MEHSTNIIHRNRSSPKQLAKMISIIESEPDFQTRSKFKGNQSSFWRKLARELNALGPPSRDPTAWKKAWIDYKFGARKRLAQREKQIASGAVPRPLTSLERKLSHLLDIDIMKITTLEENQSYVDSKTSRNVNGVTEIKEHDNTYYTASKDSFYKYNLNTPSDTHGDESWLLKAAEVRQKRLARLPHLSLVKQGICKDVVSYGADSLANESVQDQLHDSSQAEIGKESDPLCSDPETPEFTAAFVDGKRSKADYFEKVLDVNRSLVAATNMSLNLQNELITELRGMKQSNEQIIASCAEVNANLKSMTATLQELVAVLKSK